MNSEAENNGATDIELACIAKLPAAGRRGRPCEPVSAAELLAIGGAALDPLFNVPPVGPVPDYLRPHLWVHGCIAEYEEKYDELDRWKTIELDRWLQGRVGGKWRIGAEVYELRAQEDRTGGSRKFWLRGVEDRTGCACPGDDGR